MLPELSSLPSLTPPFDLLDLRPGDSQALDLVRGQLGKSVINPRDGRPRKEVYTFRVWVTPGTKPTVPDFWDITATTVIAALWAYMEAGDFPKATYRLMKVGQGAQARFSLDRLPRA